MLTFETFDVEKLLSAPIKVMDFAKGSMYNDNRLHNVPLSKLRHPHRCIGTEACYCTVVLQGRLYRC